MENLEEMKKYVDNFIKTKSYSQRYSSYTVLSSLRIFNLVIDRLMLGNKKSTVPTMIDINFLISLIHKKEFFSIESIRFDLLAGLSIIDVAIKYCEPQEVIKEILDRDLRSDEEIVASKIYNVKELCKVFKKRILITDVPLLMDISDKKNNDASHWWTGEVLLKNYSDIVNYFNKKPGELKIGDIKYITLEQAAKLLNIKRKTIEYLIYAGKNIFGVKMAFKKIKIYGGKKLKIYLPLEEVNKVKNNIKYYIKHSDFFNFNVMTAWHMRILKKQYLYTYYKKIDFSSTYLRKDSIENFIALAEQYGYKREDLIKRD